MPYFDVRMDIDGIVEERARVSALLATTPPSIVEILRDIDYL
jgi:hypothetical protein